MPNGCGQRLMCRMAPIAAVLCWASPGWAGTISLWREAVVVGDDVLLSDVCRFSGLDAAETQTYEELVVTAAPVPGGSTIVSSDDVGRALQAVGVNLASVVIKGAASCDVTRPRHPSRKQARPSDDSSPRGASSAQPRTRSLRDVVEEVLNAELAAFGGRASVRYGRVRAAALELREPDFTFEMRQTSGGRLGLVGLEVTVLSAGRQVQLIPLVVNVSMVKRVVVAARAINLGATISAGDVRLVEMTFTRLEQMGATDPAAVIGQRAKRFIASGQIVMPRHLEPVPLVKRGQIVDVHSRVGQVAIVSSAKALGSGAYGDVVDLRAGKRGRERFSATVTGPGRVTVRAASGSALAMGGDR